MTERTFADPATGRHVRVLVRLPAIASRAPLLVYSPGLGSGTSAGAPWCEAWQKAGFTVAAIDHPASGSDVWKLGAGGLTANLNRALASGQYALRLADCRHVIAALASDPEIGPRVDAMRLGIAGHSYGAYTVQSFARDVATGRDRDHFRLLGAIALSPTARSAATARMVANVRTPFFCVTGSRDNTVTFGAGREAKRLGMALATRRAVYESLPAGAKRLLVLDHADHMTFAGEALAAGRYSRDIAAPAAEDPRAWSKITAATTTFWQHYLTGDAPPPRRALDDAIRVVLDGRDRYASG